VQFDTRPHCAVRKIVSSSSGNPGNRHLDTRGLPGVYRFCTVAAGNLSRLSNRVRQPKC